MPCGPLYPVDPVPAGPGGASCFHCGGSEGVLDHFCDEWDCLLHAKCCFAFLGTEEGQIMLSHGHEAIVWAVDRVYRVEQIDKEKEG